MATFAAPVLRAQNFAPQADPADFGLSLPNAPPLPGEGRRVQVKDPATNQVVVGLVHLEVADHFVVTLPSGRLISVPAREATLTERKFEPASKEAIVAELTKDKFKDFKTRTTKRYVYVYNTSEPFFKATSTILETMYPALFAYCKRQKIDVQDPAAPLVVIMFRTQAEFEVYRRMPDGVAAYYNGVTNHVVMYEQSRLGEVAPELAIKQAISTIAHEGVHQILHNIGVQQRLSRWPMWIAEGLPEYFAPTQVDKGVRWKGVGLVNDLRMLNLQEFLKQTGGASSGDTVKNVVAARTLTAEGYAAAWALTHYLAANKQDAFFKYLREVSKSEPLADDPAADVALFERSFGADYAALETGMLKHLKKLPYVDPIANQTHYVGVLTVGNVRHFAIATATAQVAKWQQDILAAASPPERSAARFQLQAFPGRAAAEAYIATLRN